MRPRVLIIVFAALSATITAAPAVDSTLAFKASSDHPNGIYAAGEMAVLTVTRSESTPPATIEVLRNNRELVHSKEIPPGADSETMETQSVSEAWFVCAAQIPGQKKPLELSGVVFAPDRFFPTIPAPGDFDTFWNEQKARLATEVAHPKLTPLTAEQRAVEAPAPDQQRELAEYEQQGFEVQNLERSCLDVRPLRAYFAKPKTAAGKKHPAILFFRAAGVDGAWCRSSALNALRLAEQHDALVVDLNAHGMLNGQPQAYYTALARGELNAYQIQGKESRERFYFLGMFLRLLRAIDFVTTQPEWDGRHLICVGISQGGAQALAAAGLDSRVSAVVATVPAMCDLSGAVANKRAGWPAFNEGNPAEEQTQIYLKTVRYFDAVNFCQRSKAATLMTVGLVDTTCPPPGVYAAYNVLTGPKRIIPVPDKGHKALSSPPRELVAQYDAFIEQHARSQP